MHTANMTTVNTVRVAGMTGISVKGECKVSPGIGIHLVGLADASVKESLLR